jgi:hypothetical protein
MEDKVKVEIQRLDKFERREMRRKKALLGG